MDAPAWEAGPPQRLLLATDLSARCDRALDRAVQLAGQWGSGLDVLTVLEHGQMPDQVLAWLDEAGSDGGEARVARRLLARELAGLQVPASVELARGDPVTAIRRRAAATNAPLLVMGLARDEPFGRLLPGSTTEALARSGPPMVLVVRNRPHGPYGQVLVLTDFSATSRHGLRAALRLFPGNDIVLYHAYQPPYAGLVSPEAQQQAARQLQDGEARDFLEAAQLTPHERARVSLVVEAGPVEIQAARYVRNHGIELAVIGSHGRSGVLDLLLGSSAAKLLQWLPSDTLVVREPRAPQA